MDKNNIYCKAMESIPKRKADRLYDAGYTSYDSIANASDSKLRMEVRGLGKTSVNMLRQYIPSNVPATSKVSSDDLSILAIKPELIPMLKEIGFDNIDSIKSLKDLSMYSQFGGEDKNDILNAINDINSGETVSTSYLVKLYGRAVELSIDITNLYKKDYKLTNRTYDHKCIADEILEIRKTVEEIYDMLQGTNTLPFQKKTVFYGYSSLIDTYDISKTCRLISSTLSTIIIMLSTIVSINDNNK